MFSLRTSDGAVGYGDPREIKDFLTANGIPCWIDVERVGVVGICFLFIYIYSFLEMQSQNDHHCI